MKIVRYQNPAGQIFYDAQQPSGEIVRIKGDIFSKFHARRPVARGKIV